jgi:hypothetical protein
MKILAALITFAGFLLQAQQPATDRPPVRIQAQRRFPPEIIIEPDVKKLVPGPICIYRSGPEGKITFETCRPGSSPSYVVWITPKAEPAEPPKER